MNDIVIAADSMGKTPLVEFKTNGELRIEGRSIPENALEFYDPLLVWLSNLQKHLPESIYLIIRLEYFNSSSSKLILYLFKNLERIYRNDHCPVTIFWHYSTNDDEMLEAGKDYQSIINVPFEFIAY